MRYPNQLRESVIEESGHRRSSWRIGYRRGPGSLAGLGVPELQLGPFTIRLPRNPVRVPWCGNVGFYLVYRRLPLRYWRLCYYDSGWLHEFRFGPFAVGRYP